MGILVSYSGYISTNNSDNDNDDDDDGNIGVNNSDINDDKIPAEKVVTIKQIFFLNINVR